MDFQKGTVLHFVSSNFRKIEDPIDKGKVFGVLLTDFLKSSDYLQHETLTGELNGYGFSLPALRQVHDYLSNGKQGKRLRKHIAVGQK